MGGEVGSNNLTIRVSGEKLGSISSFYNNEKRKTKITRKKEIAPVDGISGGHGDVMNCICVYLNAGGAADP